MSTTPTNFTFLTPVDGAVVGRSMQLIIRPGSVWGQSVGVTARVTFMVNGSAVASAPMTIAAVVWSWQGIVPAAIRAGQPFTIFVGAQSAPGPIQLGGLGSVDVVLENVVPTLNVAPIQSPKGVTKLPYMFTLAGTSSEGNGPP